MGKLGFLMKNRQYLIGIDIGTSASKMTVIGLDGNIIYYNSCAYCINYLPNGFVEQNPDQWYISIVQLMKDFLLKIKLNDGDILSMGISSQSNALVAVDGKGNLLHPAILYLDKRATGICSSFTGTKEGERIYELTGSTLKPSYTGPQISWMKKNKPDIYKNTEKFLTANGYMIFKLTSNYSQDHTQTGMTGIYDREQENWSEELLEYFGIDRKKIPNIYRSTDIVGRTGTIFKKNSGFPTGVSVVAGTLDVASTMFGSGCIDPGSCFIEMGSVINIAVLVDRPICDKNLQIYPSAVSGTNIVAGSVDGAGNTIKWFLDEIYHGNGKEIKTADNEIFDILEKQMSTTKIGAGNLMFLPFMAGMRTPRSDLKTRGAFLGLKVSHKKIDMYRSILEGCSYGLKFNLEFMLAKSLELKKAITSGGGSKNKFWMQMISDILGIAIKRSQYDGGASIGSAMLAGIGSGAFKGFKHAVEVVCKYDYDFIPEEKKTGIYNKYYKKYKNFMDGLVFELDKLERIKNER